MGESVRDASSARFRDKTKVGAIMQKGRDKIKPSDAVSCPGCAFQGGVVDDDELSWGVDGLCGEVVGCAVFAFVFTNFASIKTSVFLAVYVCQPHELESCIDSYVP